CGARARKSGLVRDESRSGERRNYTYRVESAAGVRYSWPPMNITIVRESTAAVARLAGRLDGEAALQRAQALEALLREGRRLVTLDLSGVTYLSSPGILALQQAHQEYAVASGERAAGAPSRGDTAGVV